VEEDERERDPVAHISAYIPRELKDRLVDLANAHDRSASAELRQAIAAWLERFDELEEAA
jgi:predicted transcriptional regulator